MTTGWGRDRRGETDWRHGTARCRPSAECRQPAEAVETGVAEEEWMVSDGISQAIQANPTRANSSQPIQRIMESGKTTQKAPLREGRLRFPRFPRVQSADRSSWRRPYIDATSLSTWIYVTASPYQPPRTRGAFSQPVRAGMWLNGNGLSIEPVIVRKMSPGGGSMSRFETIAFANAPVVA